MTITSALLPLLLGLGAQTAEAKPNVAPPREIRTNGFEIDSLEIGETDAPMVQVLSLMLPASGRFAPNVNVQIQQFEGTLDEYAALSRKQFDQANAKVLFYEKRGDMLFGEYSAALGGQSLHFYAKTLQSGGRIYLATATATEAQWPQVGAKLKACVDSLTLPAATKPR
jgi:hypothetical protein